MKRGNCSLFNRFSTVLFCVAVLALCSACQATGLIASPAVASQMPANRLMLCERGKIIEILVQPDGQTQRTERLTLPKGSSCPQWSPQGNGGIVTLFQELSDSNHRGRSIYETQLNWYDAATATLSGFHQLQDQDGAFEPIWQGELQPPLALVSTRNSITSCSPYASSALEKIICRNAMGSLFLLERDEHLTPLLERQANHPFCRMRVSPNGFWLAVMQGSCSSTAYDHQIKIIRLDAEESYTVPLSPSIHSVASLIWHPSKPMLLITAQQTRIRPATTDLLVYDQVTQRLTTWASGLRNFAFAQWRGDELVFVDGADVLVARADQLHSQMLGNLSAAAMRCISFFNLSQDERILARRDRCEQSYPAVQWFDLAAGQAHSAHINYSAIGNGALSPNGDWIAVTAWVQGLPGPNISVGQLLLINTRSQQVSELGPVAVNAQMSWFLSP